MAWTTAGLGGETGEAFYSPVLHYTSSLRDTKQYWQSQQSLLLSTVDILALCSLPTVRQTSNGQSWQ